MNSSRVPPTRLATRPPPAAEVLRITGAGPLRLDRRSNADLECGGCFTLQISGTSVLRYFGTSVLRIRTENTERTFTASPTAGQRREVSEGAGMVEGRSRWMNETDRLVTDLAYFLRSSKKAIVRDAVAEFAETHHPRLPGARDDGRSTATGADADGIASGGGVAGGDRIASGDGIAGDDRSARVAMGIAGDDRIRSGGGVASDDGIAGGDGTAGGVESRVAMGCG